MARFPGDTLLEKLAASRHSGLRRWAARKAADRALHWAALKGGADDPYVLMRLGLYPYALAKPAGDRKGEVAQTIAAAAMGEGGPNAPVPATLKQVAARAIAPANPRAALALLPGDAIEAGAACLIAMGDAVAAAALVSELDSREALAMRAHIAVAAGDPGGARRLLNAMFVNDGLGPPLGDGDGAFGIDALQSPTPEPLDGPQVSVVVPYHDAADTLPAAVESLLAQSWRNLEILLVDDRSTDESPAIAAALAAKDGRVVTLENRQNSGVYGARNTAIDAATGEFVTFLDADDWSPAERIARQVHALGGHALAIANHIRMDEAGCPVAPRVYPLVRPVPITMLLRRATLVEAGPFEQTKTGADSEMFARLEMLHGKRSVARDAAILLVARWRSGSLSDASEGGMLGTERYAYRADWMFRHAGLAPPRLPVAPGNA
ncbi:glycosyltransferase family 2 protein [Parasphingopyxis marina]|uniref:Glycosyltransferase family 2 protein n=1 Tax=Parasphingopyxis marina TaxID=2761622 RepID=A0A842I0S2_9SPHN|nr:glycosyltransferase family A protein [Parasphingopyxis marina]MBC2778301.1 glycosyltransferase family 2 protein [Parasphingopyxis marina]